MYINSILGSHKISFIPQIVGDFLKLALIPEPDLRRTTIPIFFDMIQCEYYSSRFQRDHGNTKRDSTLTKANFQEFQNELISKLDHFIVEDGDGDDLFLHMFKSIMMKHCKEHTSICEPGVKYVELTAQLIKHLLEYRTTKRANDSRMNLMSCTVDLIDFYDSIHRDELYVKYLKELSRLHEKYESHAEAGFAILKYARLLDWSNAPLYTNWNDNENEITRKSQTHRELKEQLYWEIIDLFDNGKAWEKALEICEELMEQYKSVTFDYTKMARILTKMSTFYDNIMNLDVPERSPIYYRVSFIGRGFPAFLQNKNFIYRGKGFEGRNEFVSRILDQFPHAEEKKKLEPPTEAEKESIKQIIQINKVKTEMDEKPMFEGKKISPQILNYYKLNELTHFSESAKFQRGPKDKDNEFKNLWIKRTVFQTRDSLPGMLQWSPVVDPPIVIECSPLDNAIETMKNANEELRDMIQGYQFKDQPFNLLSMKVKGTIGELKFKPKILCTNVHNEDI